MNLTNTCTVCEKHDTKLCNGCKAAAYCSKTCQKKDWRSHKLLCTQISSFSNEHRPDSFHTRALHFPADKAQPEFIWVKHECGYGDDLKLGLAVDNVSCISNVLPYILTAEERQDEYAAGGIGIDDINANPRTKTGRKFDRNIEMIYRDKFLSDGSETNKAMLASTTSYGKMKHDWRGGVVAVAKTQCAGKRVAEYVDIDLTHFRMIIDYTVWYDGPTEMSVETISGSDAAIAELDRMYGIGSAHVGTVMRIGPSWEDAREA